MVFLPCPFSHEGSTGMIGLGFGSVSKVTEGVFVTYEP